MRTIETDLWPLEQPREDLGLGVFINVENAPELVGLTEGVHVILLETNELRVEGVVHKVTFNGLVWWFGEIGDPNKIEVIYQEADTAESARK